MPFITALRATPIVPLPPGRVRRSPGCAGSSDPRTHPARGRCNGEHSRRRFDVASPRERRSRDNTLSMTARLSFVLERENDVLDSIEAILLGVCRTDAAQAGIVGKRILARPLGDRGSGSAAEQVCRKGVRGRIGTHSGHVVAVEAETQIRGRPRSAEIERRSGEVSLCAVHPCLEGAHCSEVHCVSAGFHFDAHAIAGRPVAVTKSSDRRHRVIFRCVHHGNDTQ